MSWLAEMKDFADLMLHPGRRKRERDEIERNVIEPRYERDLAEVRGARMLKAALQDRHMGAG